MELWLYPAIISPLADIAKPVRGPLPTSNLPNEPVDVAEPLTEPDT